MSRVSVIIPARNAQEYIDKCISSLNKGGFRDYEAIIVDDCSSDRTAELLSKYDVKLIKLEKQSGPGYARNIAVKNSTGEMLAFTDADVIVPEDWLSNFVKKIEVMKVQCIASGYSGSVGNKYIQHFAFAELEYRRKSLPEFVPTFASNNFFCTKKAFQEIGGFPENYRVASLEDMVFSYKMSGKYKVYWDRENGVLHHFKKSFGKYLKQQFIFAADTVLTYCDYPKLFLIKTHQGRSLYAQTLITLLTLLTPLYSIRLLTPGLAIIFLMNLEFLIVAKRKHHLPIVKTFFTIILRNFSIISGVAFGCVKLILR